MRAGMSENGSHRPFEGLKKSLKKKKKEAARRQSQHDAVHPPSTPRAELAPVAPSDDELFMQAMSDVREIGEFRSISPKRGKIRPVAPEAADDEAVSELLRIVRRQSRIRISDTSEYSEWAFPGARADLTERLHGGEFSVQGQIDLHGLSEEEAWLEVSAFMDNARKAGLRCVKVIHGRGLKSPGKPVLKGAVHRWLKGQLSKYVLAYSTARACDGGLGATYVMLKHK